MIITKYNIHQYLFFINIKDNIVTTGNQYIYQNFLVNLKYYANTLVFEYIKNIYKSQIVFKNI